MKILIDIRLLSRGGQSGVEEYTIQVLKHLFLAEKNYQFKLFYNGLRKINIRISDIFEISGVQNIEIIDWKIPNKIFDLLRLNLDRFIEADVFYSPHLNFLNTVSKPRILTIHDLSFLHHPCFFSLKHRLWHKIQNIKKQAEEASCVVTDSEYTKKDIAETLKALPEKIKVIYPGINLEIFDIPFGMSDIQKLNIQKLRPYILYLGTIEPRKNVGLIIDAFEKLKTIPQFKDLKLVLAGRWGWLYKKIAQKIYTSPHSKDIVLWSPVRNEDKILLYNLAEVFIYPSFFEGFGFPPLEAQACGCPVVASNRTSLPEVLGNSAILIDPWKANQLAEALEAVIASPNLKSQMVSKGLKNVRRFNWQKTTCDLLELFSRFSS